VAINCKCGNELSESIKCREFLDWLRNPQLFKKDSASRFYLLVCLFGSQLKKRIRLPPETRYFSVLHTFYNGSKIHTASLSLVNGRFFLGVRGAGA
jgi:hypothetical protein